MRCLYALIGLLAFATAAIPENMPGHIPVSEVGCWYDPIVPEDLQVARTRFEQWGKNHTIRQGTMYGKAYRGAAIWICNCKHFRRDPVVAAELDDAQAIIEDTCGVNKAGWVWSKRWQKSFNIGTSTRMSVHNSESDKCPGWCIW